MNPKAKFISYFTPFLLGLLSLQSPARSQQDTIQKVEGSVVTPLTSDRSKMSPMAAGQSIAKPAFTNVLVFIPSIKAAPPQTAKPSVSSSLTETPASAACIYGFGENERECNPNKVSKTASGGSKAIGIVDAYHNANVRDNLRHFSEYFSLPYSRESLDIHYAPHAGGALVEGPTPPTESTHGWELEISLDVQWAHAFAPSAKIILVEAQSNSLDDLMVAEDYASKLVADAGGGQISNSWGAPERQDEANLHKHFQTKGITYFAATGDTPGTELPSIAPNIIAVGGTSILRDAAGNFKSEAAWVNGGGGVSRFEKRPAYQDSISNLVKSNRGVPDVSAIADPEIGGVWVYEPAYPTAYEGWVNIGGTSVATPIVAAVANNAGKFLSSSGDELALIYKKAGSSSLNDVLIGMCGPNNKFKAAKGWDFCTGHGSPHGSGGF